MANLAHPSHISSVLTTKTGHIVAVDHAMAGQREIELLTKEIFDQAKEADIEMKAMKLLNSMKNI